MLLPLLAVGLRPAPLELWGGGTARPRKRASMLATIPSSSAKRPRVKIPLQIAKCAAALLPLPLRMPTPPPMPPPPAGPPAEEEPTAPLLSPPPPPTLVVPAPPVPLEVALGLCTASDGNCADPPPPSHQSTIAAACVRQSDASTNTRHASGHEARKRWPIPPANNVSVRRARTMRA